MTNSSALNSSPLRAFDLFSCVGCHAIGFDRAGIETVAFCEFNETRWQELARQFPGIPIYDDIRTMRDVSAAEIVVGGPPCQRTSVAAAIHDCRDGQSL